MSILIGPISHFFLWRSLCTYHPKDTRQPARLHSCFLDILEETKNVIVIIKNIYLISHYLK